MTNAEKKDAKSEQDEVEKSALASEREDAFEDGPPADEDPMDLTDEELSLETLLGEREALARERDELFDKLQRTAAEFQNFRRRSQAQLEDQVRFRMENLFQDVITVLDSMDAAFSGAETTVDNPSARAILEGFDQIRSLLRSMMDRNGLTRIPTTGAAFDPRLHEVLFTEETDEVPPDTVLQELRAGYLLRERVLRPAQVKVSKSPADLPRGEDSSEEGEAGGGSRGSV